MKLILVLSFFAFLFATAQASTKATNAHRLARGLPPIAPQRLYVPSNVNGASLVFVALSPQYTAIHPHRAIG